MTKNCFKKVQKCLKENIHFITCYETKKTAIFCSAKDSISNTPKSTRYLQSQLPWFKWRWHWKNWSQFSYEIKWMKISLCTCRNVNTLDILLIYLDYQTSMLQQQRSITNNTLLTLLFLTFVFWAPAVTGPICYF